MLPPGLFTKPTPIYFELSTAPSISSSETITEVIFSLTIHLPLSKFFLSVLGLCINAAILDVWDYFYKQLPCLNPHPGPVLLLTESIHLMWMYGYTCVCEFSNSQRMQFWWKQEWCTSCVSLKPKPPSMSGTQVTMHKKGYVNGCLLIKNSSSRVFIFIHQRQIKLQVCSQKHVEEYFVTDNRFMILFHLLNVMLLSFIYKTFTILMSFYFSSSL